MWTKSACAAAACTILLILAVAAMTRSAPGAQAVTRTPKTSSTSTTTVGSTTSPAGRSRVTLTAALRPAAPAAGRYQIQPGNTLSGIAAALAVPGGWPALYAANRDAIGPDPALIRAGTSCGCPARPRPGTPSAPGTPCPASPPRWRCPAAGRPCTPPTATPSAPTRP